MKNQISGLAFVLSSLIVVGCGSGASTTSNSITPTPVATITAVASSTSLSAYATYNSVGVGGQTTIIASGGTAPYTYSMSGSAGGLLSGNLYTAGTTSGTEVITVADNSSPINTTTVTITVGGSSSGGGSSSSLYVTEGSNIIAMSGTDTLTVSGGTAPYTWVMSSNAGTGSVVKTNSSGSTATYTAPSYPTVAGVMVTDANGLTQTATITVQHVSPLVIAPMTVTLFPGTSYTFTVSGGLGNYSYGMYSGYGSMSGPTYTAPGFATNDVVEVWDGNGNVAKANITVVTPTTMNSTASLRADDSVIWNINIPNDLVNYSPSIIIGGAASNGVLGVNTSSTPSAYIFGSTASQSSAGITLSNYVSTTTEPYVGNLVIQGRNGTEVFAFCIQPGYNNTFVKKVSASNSLTLDYNSAIYSNFSSGSSAGTALTSLWIHGIDAGWDGAGPVNVSLQAAGHTNQYSNCGGFSDFTLSSQSSN